jgi:hypothetical protein
MQLEAKRPNKNKIPLAALTICPLGIQLIPFEALLLASAGYRKLYPANFSPKIG